MLATRTVAVVTEQTIRILRPSLALQPKIHIRSLDVFLVPSAIVIDMIDRKEIGFRFVT